MMENLILEACVETLEEALAAQQKGAHRVELCADLSQDGLTPTRDLIASCIQSLSIPVMVMIRPRGGNFIYNKEEIRQMELDIEYFKHSGVAGLVLGLLNDKDEIDVLNTQMLVSLASPLEVTFHKAIDSTPDILQSFQTLNNIQGLTRVLTSGGRDTAWKGRSLLQQMNHQPDRRIKIIAAGKINPENCHQIADYTGINELHGKRIV